MEAVEITVLRRVVLDNNQRVLQLTSSSGVSWSSLHKILKAHDYRSSKLKILYELDDDIIDRRLHFYEQMRQKLNGNENPHLYREAHTQHLPKTECLD